jgi:hypothetical protein
MQPEKTGEFSRLPWRMSLIWTSATLAFVITGLVLSNLLNF